MGGRDDNILNVYEVRVSPVEILFYFTFPARVNDKISQSSIEGVGIGNVREGFIIFD